MPILIADIRPTGKKQCMSAIGRTRWSMSLVAIIGLNACSPPEPVTIGDVKHYTGIELCSAASVHDLTTKEERNTTPGFSYHVAIELPRECAAHFERQLATLSPIECSAERLRGSGCFVKDAYPEAAKHSSIMIHPLSGNRFDLRFYE